MLRVKVTFTAPQGSPWRATHNFSDTADQTNANEVNAAVGVFWSAVDLLISNVVTWTTEAAVENIDVTTGQIQGLFPVTPATGTGASSTEALPQSSQGLIRWRTGQYGNGREARGRTFIPGLTESTNNAGLLLASSITVFDAAATAFVADANSVLAVYQRPRPGVNGALFDVTGGTTWSKFAVLRSRRD